MAKRSGFRIEHDSMGDLQVPADALWGAQTQRALDNFRISGRPMPAGFVRALAQVKAAAAAVNARLGLLDPARAYAIAAAARAVADGQHAGQFPLDRYQTGSGTSSNMNANEVIAYLAERASGLAIHPNDHVNLGQSSNDAVPTAMRVMAVHAAMNDLLPALKHLRKAIDKRAKSIGKTVKTGRTHLMDAMPLTFAQEFGAWSAQLASAQARIEDSLRRVRRLPIGGTAIGTGINAHPDYAPLVCRKLTEISGIPVVTAPNLIEATQDCGAFVQLSGVLKRVAVKLSKTCNDLRLLSSGPRAGLGEINLPARQAGSSIMPGKVNPVIPEVVNQIAFEVIGNDMTVTFAAEAGQLQLNAFEPIIAHSMFKSVMHLRNGCLTLADNCVDGITANRELMLASVRNSIGIVTALNPYIGYANATEVAAEAHASGRGVAEIVLERGLMSREKLDEVLRPEVLTRPQAIVATHHVKEQLTV